MSKTVLVVEDRELDMKIFIDLLQAGGYGTIEAVDGETALDMARARRPDLILMDIRLPGIDGVKATKVLKADAEMKSIPVLAVTAFAMQGDEEKFLAAGCEGFVFKPVTAASLLPKVARLLE